MATKTDILNKALTLIGAAPVTSIDDSTNNARVLARVYETSLRSVLYECKWNFATKRTLLSASTYTPEWYDTGENQIYTRPTDVVRIFGAHDQYATWREEGDYIFSDTSNLGIRYVYFNDSPNTYPAYFIDALVDRLCADIAYMVVNSSSLAEKYKSLYENVTLPKAMAANSQVGTQQVLQDDAWTLSKYQDSNTAL